MSLLRTALYDEVQQKRGYIYAQVTASVIQRFQNDNVIVRILKSYCWYPKYKPCELCFSESIREIIRPNGSGGFEVVPFHNTSDTAALTTWKRGYPPILYFNQYSFARETCGHLYCRNLKRELKGIPWQYCQLEAFYKGNQNQMKAAPYLGRSGEIAPVAVFDTVEIDGCDVSRASLHNLSFIDGLELMPKNRILVSKRDTIIPHVEENLNRGNFSMEAVIPHICPCCGQATRIHENNCTKTLFCDNGACETRRLRQFVYYAISWR